MKNEKNKSLIIIIVVLLLAYLIAVIYTYYILQSVIGLLVVEFGYFILLMYGVHLLSKSTEKLTAIRFLVSQILIIVGLFVLVFITYILKPFEINRFISFTDTITIATFSLVITAFFMPQTEKKIKGLDNERNMVIFFTLASSIIFFLTGFFGFVFAYMFSSTISEINYMVIEVFFFLGCLDLIYASFHLFSYFCKKAEIKSGFVLKKKK